MENYKFRQLLLDTASNYDGMSQELFKLAHMASYIVIFFFSLIIR